MKIGINVLFLKQGLSGGTETYSMCMLQAMATLPGEHIFYIFCSSEMQIDFLTDHPRFKIIRFRKVSRSIIYRYFFEQLIFPFRIKKYELDILHSFGYIGPCFVKNHIVTIHDANAFAHKSAMPLRKRVLFAFFLLVISRSCKHIITVSNFSKNEILKYLWVSPDKVEVVYEAAKPETIDKNFNLAKRYAHLSEIKYFIGLSSPSAHKNMQTLVSAYTGLAQRHPDVKLVLAGHLPSRNGRSPFFCNNPEIQNNIVLTGFTTDVTLQALMQNALCFVFPSLYEGFGLPLLEAQNVGTVVIASDRGSLPEIGGDSAIYFPARDATILAAEMEELLLNENKRIKYAMLGRENTKRFSWEKAAKETLKIYESQKNS